MSEAQQLQLSRAHLGKYHELACERRIGHWVIGPMHHLNSGE